MEKGLLAPGVKELVRGLAILGLAAMLPMGCSFGPRALEKTHGKFNEAYKQVDSEELLLNIVRLRYNDSPAEVEVSSIAAQYELGADAQMRPFWESQVSNGIFRTFSSVLPFADVSGTTRPTFSLTPIHSGDSAARYLRPITIDGVAYLAETSFPISTIFRIWLEGINGVPNAPSASGPTRSFAPEYAEFRQVTELMQRLQDRGEMVFRKIEEEVPGDPLPLDRVNGDAQVEARKAGLEYRLSADKTAWQLIKKAQKLYLEFHPRAIGTPDHTELLRLLQLKPDMKRYEVIQDTAGFSQKQPGAAPTEKVALVSRSLIQVLFYLAHGVDVPADHLACGVAKLTHESDGSPFDWQQVTGGLFTVRSCGGKKPPAGAAVSVRYRGYWYYIDDADPATKSTFLFLRPARQLDFGAVAPERRGTAPLLTLPVGR